MKFFALFLLLLTVVLSGCTRRKEIWVYTSLPKEVIAEMVEPLRLAVPEASVRWYQSSSETVGNRIDLESEAGRPRADLVLTNDPFWYAEMKRKGQLLAYDSSFVKEVPEALRDPDHAFATVRLPVMVMAYNPNHIKAAELPERWKDLTQARFKLKVSMANPLEISSSYVVLAFLSKLYGWEYFAELKKLGLVAEGPPSSVLTRIETGERPIGILPLETVLRATSRTSAIKAIYPLDGAVPIPGPIAILKESKQPEIAKRVYDWFFSSSAQTCIVHGALYSPLPKIASPEGARPWSETSPVMMKWSPEILSDLSARRDQIRAKFSEVVLH